jgi:maleate cis-trans isomerase
MGKHALVAALLASASVDLLCYYCTVETMLVGIEYNEKLTHSLQKATEIPDEL